MKRFSDMSLPELDATLALFCEKYLSAYRNGDQLKKCANGSLMGMILIEVDRRKFDGRLLETLKEWNDDEQEGKTSGTAEASMPRSGVHSTRRQDGRNRNRPEVSSFNRPEAARHQFGVVEGS